VSKQFPLRDIVCIDLPRGLERGLDEPERKVIPPVFTLLLEMTDRGNFDAGLLEQDRCFVGVERRAADRVVTEFDKVMAKGDVHDGERRRCREGDLVGWWAKRVAVSPWWR
jgi:hypothetical protein